MAENQQASTLAFLQNFYTDVTLYVPFEAHEQTPPAPVAPEASAAVSAPLRPPAASAPVPAAPTPMPLATAPATVPPVAAAPGKLPSLANLTPPAPVRPAVSAPVAAPVAPPAATPEPAPYLRTTFDTLGRNAQGVVLLVRLPDAQFQKLPRNVFLNKLLQAINLVMADVVLVNVNDPYPVALANLRREIAAPQILAFGKNLLDVAVRTTQIYEPVQFPTLGLAYLAAAEVEMVEYDVSLKKRLWSGLKAMFLQD